VVTEVAGFIKFQDFVDNVTVQKQTDDVTGLSSTVVLDAKQRGLGGKDLRPVVRLVNAKGKEVTFANTEIPAVYSLPAGALVSLEDGVQVSVGDVLSLYARVVRVGRTSITMHVEAWAERRPDNPIVVKVTQANITYVAIDSHGKPRPFGEQTPEIKQ